MTTLQKLASQASGCELCALSETRNRVVFGSGNPRAAVFLIGEAPGRNEDEGGEPFAGQAGRVLNEALAAAGLERRDLYIANVLKCRPPKNRNPKREEIASCRPWLEQQLTLVDPVVVVPMGNFALRLFQKDAPPISKARGVPFDSKGRTVLPIFHPAAILYNRSLEGTFREDFARIAKIGSSLQR
ncbi:MAG: uracil-DNA glycosylase [Gemmatimonadetes bacterium]|nr:uracil-DNA glycosylase [Gemmatimonadota bacterium]